MKLRVLALFLAISAPLAVIAMENRDLSDAIDSANEDGVLASIWVQPAGQEEQLVADFDDLPEEGEGGDSNMVEQLRKFTLDEQIALNAQVGPQKFNEVSGVVEYKLFGHKDAKQSEKNNSDSAKE